jgi:hypothetical protein
MLQHQVLVIKGRRIVQTGTRNKYISTNNPKGRASQKKRAHEKIATPSTKITNAQSLQID